MDDDSKPPEQPPPANSPGEDDSDAAEEPAGDEGSMWYYESDGQQRGPVSQEDLCGMAQQGQLEGSLVWRQGMEEWTPSEFLPDIITAFEQKPSRGAKRKRDVPESVPPQLEEWLKPMDTELLSGFFAAACDVPGMLIGAEQSRDRLLHSYVERDDELEGTPDDYEFTDDFFFDVLDVQGYAEFWKMMYPGNEEDALNLIANAAKNDRALLNRIESAHFFGLVAAAVKAGDVEAVVRVIEEKPDVVQLANKDGQTALHLAAKEQNADIVRAIIDTDLERGDAGEPELVNVDEPDSKGNTALHIAAEAGDTDIAEILLDSGADPNLQNDAGEYGGGNWSKKTAGDTELQPIADRDKTPLHIACEQDDQDMAALLLERGADTNLPDKAMMTALHHAIEEDSADLVGFLLNNGADPTLTNDNIGENNTLLHAAISRGKTTMAALLLETGKFDVNVAADGWLPLHLAARRGTAKAVKLLLEAGANPAAADGSGRTAKALAEKNNRKECVELLEAALAKASG